MKNIKIMIVEDEGIVAKDIQSVLKSMEYDVSYTTYFAEDAVKKAGELKPDMILMDIVLKGDMDGIDAAELILSEFDIPVVFLTAYTDEATLERAKKVAPYGYIVKPFEKRELRTTIEVALYKHKMEKRLRESKQWLAATLKSIGDAVIAIDNNNRVKFINDVAEIMTGWSQEDAAGKEVSEVFNIISETIDTVDEKSALKPSHIGITSTGLNNIELKNRSGIKVPVEFKVTPIINEKGAVEGNVLVFSDITERKEAEERLLHRIEMEKLVTTIATYFLNINISDTDSLIDMALESIGGFFSADRCCVYQFSGDLKTVRNAYEWCAEGVVSKKDRLQSLHADKYPAITRMLLRFEEIFIPRVSEMTAGVELEKKTFESAGIKALMLIPMVYNGQAVGFMELESLKEEKEWIREDMSLLKVVSEILVYALQHKKSIIEIQNSEELFRTAFDHAPIGKALIAPDGKYLNVNNAFCNMIGYSEQEMLSKSFGDITHTDDKEESLAAFKRFITGRQDFYTIEKRYVRKDGGIVWALINVSSVRNPNGVPKYIIVQVLDITGKKLAEDMLRQRHEALLSVYKLSTAPNSTVESICGEAVLSLVGILNVSNGLVNLVAKEQLKVISLFADGRLIKEEMTVTMMPPCSLVIKEKTIKSFKGDLKELFPENPIISKYDIRSYIGVPIKNSMGKVVGVLCMMHREDRVFNEHEIQLIEIFATYVGREIEKTEMKNRLLDAEKMKILGQLTSGVAHEVRNPLNAISVIVAALQQDLGDNPEFKPLMYHIQAQVDRLSKLMKDLLELGKPVGASEIGCNCMYLLCSEAIKVWENSQQPGYKTSLTCAENLKSVEILADAHKMQQVLINLLDNARQHCAGHCEVNIQILKLNEGFISVKIIDNGKGISMKYIDRVFDPFFTTRKGGTGLGLSIVKHFIESFSGEVKIYNNSPRPGCTVEIIMPVAGSAQ